MSVHVNDDFFSPIRFDSSVVESEECPAHVFEDNITKSRRQSELLNFSDRASINGESVDICTPVSDKRSSGLVNAKKVDKTKHKNMKKEISKNCLDYNTSQLKPEQKGFKERSLSLTSTSTESIKQNMKYTKIEKSTSQDATFKDMCVKNTHKHISSRKHLSGKRPVDNASVLKCKDDLGKSVAPKEINAIHHLTKGKLKVLTQDVEKMESTANLPLSQYEALIEKIVHDCVSSECDKMRQNVYMQQMSFYRQINKMKAEVEQQYSAIHECLFKMIEELMQMNATLKSTSLQEKTKF